MKCRNLFFGALAVIGLAIVGCSSGSTGDAGTTTGGEGKPSADSPKEKLRVGVSIPAGDHGWTAGIVWWANQMKEKYPDVDLSIQTSNNGTDQNKAVETMLVTGLDGLVVLAFEPTPVTPAVKKAKSDGVYVVSVDRGLDEPIADVWMRGDNSKFGELAADYMGSKLGGKGNILVLEGLTANDVNKARVEAFNKTMSTKYPGIKILASTNGDWDRQKAYKATQTLLAKYPMVNAIWSSDDDMSLGAEQALKESGRTNVWMLGGGGMQDIYKKIAAGEPMYPATITYAPKMIADGIERCIADLKAGKKPGDKQEDVLLPVEVVSPDNVKDFMVDGAAY